MGRRSCDLVGDRVRGHDWLLLAAVVAGVRCLLADGQPPLHRVEQDTGVGQAAPDHAPLAEAKHVFRSSAVRSDLITHPLVLMALKVCSRLEDKLVVIVKESDAAVAAATQKSPHAVAT